MVLRAVLIVGFVGTMTSCAGGQAPPGDDPTSRGAAVGYVRVGVKGETSYAVWMNGQQKGQTAIELTQRSGQTATYEVRDDAEREPICRTQIRVVERDRICLECDPSAREFRRVNCPATN